MHNTNLSTPSWREKKSPQTSSLKRTFNQSRSENYSTAYTSASCVPVVNRLAPATGGTLRTISDRLCWCKHTDGLSIRGISLPMKDSKCWAEIWNSASATRLDSVHWPVQRVSTQELLWSIWRTCTQNSKKGNWARPSQSDLYFSLVIKAFFFLYTCVAINLSIRKFT